MCWLVPIKQRISEISDRTLNAVLKVIVEYLILNREFWKYLVFPFLSPLKREIKLNNVLIKMQFLLHVKHTQAALQRPVG
jgi:hypothetical protein